MPLTYKLPVLGLVTGDTKLEFHSSPAQAFENIENSEVQPPENLDSDQEIEKLWEAQDGDTSPEDLEAELENLEKEMQAQESAEQEALESAKQLRGEYEEPDNETEGMQAEELKDLITQLQEEVSQVRVPGL